MHIKNDKEIGIMRDAGKRLAEVVDILETEVAAGVSGGHLDMIAEREIRARESVPAFKGYDAGGPIPFPGTICFSLNDEVVHGIPTDDKLISDGDLVKIDIGLVYREMYADMARTFMVGDVSEDAKKITEVTRASYNKGVAQIKDGATLEDFATAAQAVAQQEGCGVVKNLVGHGIGYALHEDPQIPNFFIKGMHNFTFKKGMVIAIEPMVNLGTGQTVLDSDGWTYKSGDGSLSAHWENTMLVTEKGTEVFTHV